MALQPKSWQQTLQELWELLRAYAAQETFGPLKTLKRQLGFGLLGSVMFSLGIFLVALGAMRFLQTHYDKTMEHNWIAYIVGCGILGGTCIVAGRKMRVPAATSTPFDHKAGAAGASPDTLTSTDI